MPRHSVQPSPCRLPCIPTLAPSDWSLAFPSSHQPVSAKDTVPILPWMFYHCWIGLQWPASLLTLKRACSASSSYTTVASQSCSILLNLVDGIQISESPPVPQPWSGPALALQSHYLCLMPRPHRSLFETSQTSQTSQTSHRVHLWLGAHLTLAATLSIRPPAGAIGADKTANCQSVSPQSMRFHPPIFFDELSTSDIFKS